MVGAAGRLRRGEDGLVTLELEVFEVGGVLVVLAEVG